MSNVRRPRMPRPKIPKITKPTLSKSRKIKKATIKAVKPVLRSSASTKSNKKRQITKKITGTCYAQTDCRKILTKDVTKTKCKAIGGKSWRKNKGICERLDNII